MSLEAAQNWLAGYPDPIPVHDELHDQVIDLLNKGIAPLSDIADLIMLDPGLSTLLIEQVNIRLKKNNRDKIETVHTAMGHLGKPAISKQITQHRKLSDVCKQASARRAFRQLLSQNHHALAQLKAFADMQGIQVIDDICAAIMLINLGEIHCSVFDPDKYQQYRDAITSDNDLAAVANRIFGFEFGELSLQLAKEWVLPDLVIESLKPMEKPGRKAQLVILASEIAFQAEQGWYHRDMEKAQKASAEYLSLSLSETRQQIHNTAILAARSLRIDDAFAAAARLILLPNIEKSAKPAAVAQKATTKKPDNPVSLAEQIKQLLQQASANQSSVLSLLLSGLHQDLGFSRVVLMVMSSDNTRLVTRTGKGLDTDSALNKLQINITQSGLITSLLEKPQAISINASNYKKYESMLPGRLKAACLCDNFAIMSLFIGKRPIGLIYVDRQHVESPIDATSYNAFKSAVMMTSKALTYLAKRKVKASA